jgi:hypothetical protein
LLLCSKIRIKARRRRADISSSDDDEITAMAWLLLTRMQERRRKSRLSSVYLFLRRLQLRARSHRS